MPAPRIKKIMGAFDQRLTDYLPARMSYLDDQGSWQKDPGEVWERASAELWYRLWEMANAGQQAELETLATILTAGESDWKRIKGTFGRGQTEGSDPALMIFLNALCRMLEFSSYKYNAGRPVAEWDQPGKKLSEYYALKIQDTYSRWGMVAGSDPQPGHPDSLLDNLLQGSEIFVKISRLIAEEDRLARKIEGLLAGPSDPKLRGEAQELILEQLDGAVAWPVDRLQHMVRPCLGLLRHTEIPISSGIQYEAACILGKVRDRRCAEAIIDQLKLVSEKHDNLSSGLLYVLGRLEEPRAAGSFIEKLNAGSPGLEIREAIWALGKLEESPATAIPFLVAQADNRDRNVKTVLAWALGRIGRASLREAGDVEPEVVAALLKLLKDDQVRVSEEALLALKNLGLPELFNRLLLHNTSGRALLSLQPSRQGLYELSETLWYLMGKHPPVVMAVTGDSGTGKTYFCQSLTEGFGRWSSKDILYLARDNPEHNDIFNRMLGLKFLKKRVLPQFYQNYPLSEEDDRPEEYFEQFMEANRDKKLIILDGWRDDAYFHHLINLFNEHEYLDVLLKFRAAYSTRRLNLEEREGLLDNVTTCLSYVEEPNLQETKFHRDGRVLIYQLENSLPARPGREEIQGLFQQRKIESWGRFIRVGKFGQATGKMQSIHKNIGCQKEKIEIIKESSALGEKLAIDPCEKPYIRRTSVNSKSTRYLLETIETEGISLNCIALMGPGQVAFGGKDGQVGVFSGPGDHLKYHTVPGGDIRQIAILGDEIWSLDGAGRLAVTSLKQGYYSNWGKNQPLVTAIASNRDQLIATGHSDGSIRLWSQREARARAVKLSGGNITAIKMGPGGKVFSMDQEGKLIVWETGKDVAFSYNTGLAGGGCICRYPGGKIAIGRTGKGSKGITEIGIIDCLKGQMETLASDTEGEVSSISAYFDGRLLVGLKGRPGKKKAGTLMIIKPGITAPGYWLLPGHKFESRSCLSMGPEILTCGSDTGSDDSLKIWGSADYVRQERKRSRLLDSSMIKPSHFQNIL